MEPTTTETTEIHDERCQQATCYDDLCADCLAWLEEQML
jgi:hypothetical protein